MIPKVFISYIDLYDERDIIDEDNKVIGSEQYLMKKNVKLRTQVYLEDIKRHEEVLTDNGNLKKGFTKLYLQSGDNLVVKESFDNITKMLSTNKIGFRYGRE